jgi:beta-glucosidase
LEPGETQNISFSIGTDALQFYNRDMERVVEAGEFDIMVGNSSDNVKTTVLTVE